MKSHETQTPVERVILVGVGPKARTALIRESLEELKRLSETAGAVVIGQTTQALARYHPATLIGSGKISEIASLCTRYQARTVIFDLELSPGQQKNLERALPKTKIVDRTRLILDIFSKRARTSEGRLQVELAQLAYMLPRLTGSWREFSQQAGGIGTRGPGERKLEYERRHIQLRIRHLEEALEGVRASRKLRRSRRLEIPVPQIAMIGYTNVGKSSLLNCLTKEPTVYADDKLFATLDPTARRVPLPEGGWIVVSDTVGFIQRLPTTLIAAFRATLEEIEQADVLMVLSDVSSEEWIGQRNSVDAILADLKISDFPRIDVFNKCDRLSQEKQTELKSRYPAAIFISAHTGFGIDQLLHRIEESLSTRWLKREIDVPASKLSKTGHFYQSAQVLGFSTHGELTRYKIRVTAENWVRLQALVSDN